LLYEPDAMVAKEWPHPRLKEWLGENRLSEPALLDLAQKDDSEMILPKLNQFLEEAEYRGLIEYHVRRGTGWQLREKPLDVKGRIFCRVGNSPRRTHFLTQAMRQEDLILDRFGIFNFQLPGDEIEFYLSDLTVNGQKIDFSKDPRWEGRNNHTEFVEHDFHAKQDFGYTRSQHAGQAPGEIGGTFWRTEPVDPLHAYYADDIGSLTLDDPLEFSGHIAFTAGGTDAGMAFGYFNTKDRMTEFKLEDGGEAGAPLPNALLVAIERPTRVGYYFSAQLCPADKSRRGNSEGPIIVPDSKRHFFAGKYDPEASHGRIP
jgi:hypothetical protein